MNMAILKAFLIIGLVSFSMAASYKAAADKKVFPTQRDSLRFLKNHGVTRGIWEECVGEYPCTIEEIVENFYGIPPIREAISRPRRQFKLARNNGRK